MNFLPIALGAYILGGISFIIDKTLVDNSLKNPVVYTFYIGALSLGVLILIPFFGFSIPSSEAIIYSVLSGVIFILAILTFFKALSHFNVTVVSPIVGTINPVFALILGWVLLNNTLTSNQFLSFALLILGGITITFNLWWGKHKFDRYFLIMIASGILFGLSYVLLSEAFQLTKFINGLIISRLAMGGLALTFLLFPNTRSQIFDNKVTKHYFANKLGFLVLISQGLGAISGLLTSFAVSLANPALVNSLFGVQYIMLLIAAIFLAKFHPHILDEDLNKKVLAQKIIGTLIMAFGLVFLFFT